LLSQAGALLGFLGPRIAQRMALSRKISYAESLLQFLSACRASSSCLLGLLPRDLDEAVEFPPCDRIMIIVVIIIFL
jgi:hypothetical protein